ncbi:hypothetical protein I7I50_04470 [Histoplasma capsulatum G186AR]|uniref:Uncharacterized protein n=1 Tax=Ajellomyces capsulatus TaxID=5037 RepID=A0A8H7YK88_AJECA|nr:hypothetical protein I7I52_05378 [Histoplasma capsulatum]QSS75356.1 hypothetical protein I7I50_04470 [Histoplasma capsulatum G186AR]
MDGYQPNHHLADTRSLGGWDKPRLMRTFQSKRTNTKLRSEFTRTYNGATHPENRERQTPLLVPRMNGVFQHQTGSQINHYFGC